MKQTGEEGATGGHCGDSRVSGQMVLREEEGATGGHCGDSRVSGQMVLREECW